MEQFCVTPAILASISLCLHQCCQSELFCDVPVMCDGVEAQWKLGEAAEAPEINCMMLCHCVNLSEYSLRPSYESKQMKSTRWDASSEFHILNFPVNEVGAVTSMFTVHTSV